MSVVVSIVLAALSATAQPESNDEQLRSLRRDVDALKEGMSRLQRELQVMKIILQGQVQGQVQGQGRGRAGAAEEPPPQGIVLSASDGQIKGDRAARVVLVDFTDYQCPFCGRHVRETVPKLDTEYIKTGKLKYIVRDFPIESIHPHAFKAAEAAHCAGEQGKYWEMHHRLFANQRQLAPDDLAAHAQAVALDAAGFQGCLDSGKHAARVRQDFEEGQRAGVRGTPTFFLGVQESPDAPLRVVRVIRGAQSFAGFKGAIDSVLESIKQ
jgi:protein-disulfide isomerase